MQQNLLFDLQHLGALKLQGEAAKTFLQGQISCDVQRVNPSHIERGAFCNLKGRILALADVIQWHDDLCLILPQNLLEKTNASLSKTACLSRVTLETMAHTHMLGFYLHDTKQPMPFSGLESMEQNALQTYTDACVYHLGQGFYIIMANAAAYQTLKTCFEQQNLLHDEHAWHHLRLTQGEVQIYPESRGLFLPHRLGLQNTGYLSFDKGCYKGQEIIARTHYRAKLKHGMHVFTINTTKALRPGLRLMTEDGTKELGELVDFCTQGEQTTLAASMLLDAFDTPFVFEA